MAYKSTVLVTGASTGLGYAAAAQIAKAHPELQVVVCSRSMPDTADKINAATGHSNAIWLKLDLCSHASTRAFVKDYRSRNFPPISAMLLNAALQVTNKPAWSPDGLELMFAITRVNHALLFFLLKDLLTPDANIAITASSAHDPAYKSPGPPKYVDAESTAHPDDSTHKAWTDGLSRYGNSKAANVLWAYALAERAKQQGKNWTVTAMNPGVMATQLYRSAKGLIGWVLNIGIRIPGASYLLGQRVWTPDESGELLVNLGVNWKGSEFYGKYYDIGSKQPKNEHPSSKASHEKALQKDLWDWTIKEIAEGNEAVAWKKL
jgi:NAD(P)-dependent dehydrogenase (short-subunit alcohol dehydrogenase family)